jgi:DNA-binding CsgD family transcriptional regulator
MRSSFALQGLPHRGRELAEAAASLGGGIVIFDAEDRVLWANQEQREQWPCFQFRPEDTYKDLIYALVRHGFNGNPLAAENPRLYAETASCARRHTDMDFINVYPAGRMLVSHLRLDGGMSMQARVAVKATGMERYFDGAQNWLGVVWASKISEAFRGLQSALDAVGLAVGLVDQAKRLIHANAAFRLLAERGDGILETEDGIRAADRYDHIVLAQAVLAACAGRKEPAIVPLRRPGAGDPHLLAVSPGASAGTAVLAVAAFGEDQEEIRSALGRTFDLTPAEAHVTALLGAGLSVREIADARSVDPGTAYNQVKGIKARLRRSGFAAAGLGDITSLVMRIAAITRASLTRQ